MNSKGRGTLFGLCRRIADLHRERGGTTIDPVTGEDWDGKPAYAVSQLKSRERSQRHIPTPWDIFRFVLDNWELLKQPRFVFGSWLDRGLHFFDVSQIVVDLRYAIQLAQENGQLCVWDLRQRWNIWVRSVDGAVLTEPVHGGPQPENGARRAHG